jgi:polyferredoxin
MILPRIFVPVAKLWLGLGALLGAIMSRVIMTVIFLCIVCPIAIIRRIAGGDSLQLKKWKAGRASAFTQKSHTYSSEDIHKPY